MNTFFRFFTELLSIIANGIVEIWNGMIAGFKIIFSPSDYMYLIENYSKEFNGNEWVFVTITILVLLLIIGLVGFLLYFLIKRLLKFRKTLVEQESLLDEVGKLNDQVVDLLKEKEELMALKVNQLGIPGSGGTEETTNNTNEENADGEESDEDREVKVSENSRFPQLARVDLMNINTKIVNFNNNQSLEQLVDDFRCFAASKLHLYYNIDLLRVFFSGLACGKMIILQGISGTGKTSLAYAWSKFNKLNPCVSAVQPSWRDRSDFFGYLNEFTKRFNETDALVEVYSSLYDDRIHTVVLDEMNLARVEYYFAEILSILELPARDEWLISLVTNHVKYDPVKFINGKLKLAGNVWYIGTINNDDSTFQVTDKVYDRAMPIDINTKVDPFECRVQEAVDLNSSYLEDLFKKAQTEHEITEKSMAIIAEMDNYMITHFHIAFGNRIMKQLKCFVAVYVGCGGDEVSAIDYFLCKKILRKFEQQNIAYIRDEFDPFIGVLNDRFGEGKMHECIDYIEMLKKNK